MPVRLRALLLIVITGALLCTGAGLADPTRRAGPGAARPAAEAGACPVVTSGPRPDLQPDHVGGVPVGWTRRWVAATRPVTDSQGQTWAPDVAIARGGVLRAATAPAGTGTPQVYRGERAGVGRFDIPVPTPGRWVVVVYVAPAAAPYDMTSGTSTVHVEAGAAVRHAVLVAATAGRTLPVELTGPDGPPPVSAVTVGLTGPAVDATATRFCDDFTGGAGIRPAAGNWRAETGPVGSWDGQLQTYTGDPANAGLDGRGRLAIVARREPPGPAGGTVREFTSARLNSTYRGRYGRITARIRVPGQAGTLAAFWTLGADLPDVGWPECGEIDVLESLGATGPGVVHGTLHGPDTTAGGWQAGAKVTPQVGTAIAFHDYTVDWWPGVVQLSVDGVAYASFTPADLAPGQRWPFERPAYLLLSLAVGGSWAGTPPASAPFPQVMLVDSVIWRN